MRFLRMLVSGVVIVAGLTASGGFASGASAFAITSLDVETHLIPTQGTAQVIDWAVSESLPDGQITVSFYNEERDQTETETWSTEGQLTGEHSVDWLGSGIYYATSASLENGAGAATFFSLYEDAPLLDQVWFGYSVDVVEQPTAPEVTQDTMPGPGIGEIAVVCTKSDGHGLPILDYTLTATPVAGGAPVTLTRNGASRCSDVIDGLDPGAQYEITARARTAIGSSETSNSLEEVALAGPPDAPTGLAAVPGDGSVVLSWDRPNSYGYLIDSYDVSVSCLGSHDTTVTGSPGEEAPTSVEIQNLTNGCDGSARVAAHTQKGWGELSLPTEFVPTSGHVPPPPTDLAYEWSQSGALAVGWSAQEPTNDLPESFDVEVRLDGEVVLTDTYETCCKWVTQDLDRHLSYLVRVRSLNSAGWSDWSDTLEVAGVRAPSEVIDLTVAGRADHGVASWSAPTVGDAAFYYYSVTPGRSAEPNLQQLTFVPAATFSTSLGEDYVFSVWGVSSLGDWGPASSFLLEGTDLRLRDADLTPVAGQAFAVKGKALTTFDEAPIAGTTVIVQRKLRTGSTYRSLGVSDVTGGRGRFSIEFTPRRGVSYRVALVGQAGLGASLAAIPEVVR